MFSSPRYYHSETIVSELLKFRSSHRRCSVGKGVLRKLAKFTGKPLCQSPFFNNVAACNFIKKDAPKQVFSCEFCEISKNTLFTEHLRATASRCFFKKYFDLISFSSQ